MVTAKQTWYEWSQCNDYEAVLDASALSNARTSHTSNQGSMRADTVHAGIGLLTSAVAAGLYLMDQSIVPEGCCTAEVE